jgi:hypothetical protein
MAGAISQTTQGFSEQAHFLRPAAVEQYQWPILSTPREELQVHERSQSA